MGDPFLQPALQLFCHQVKNARIYGPQTITGQKWIIQLQSSQSGKKSDREFQTLWLQGHVETVTVSRLALNDGSGTTTVKFSCLPDVRSWIKKGKQISNIFKLL